MYSAEARHNASSCAWAPFRYPPPGLRAEAKFSTATGRSASRRAAARLLSPVTSTTVAVGSVRGTGTGSGPLTAVALRAASISARRGTSRPSGRRYAPAATIRSVSCAMFRSRALMASPPCTP